MKRFNVPAFLFPGLPKMVPSILFLPAGECLTNFKLFFKAHFSFSFFYFPIYISNFRSVFTLVFVGCLTTAITAAIF